MDAPPESSRRRPGPITSVDGVRVRSPEIVSDDLYSWVPAFAGMTREGAQAEQRYGKIFPQRVSFLDEPNLPGELPLLHAPLSDDGVADVFIGFDIDQPFDAIAAREARDCFGAVFIHALSKIGGDADVKRSVPAAGKDVEVAGHSDGYAIERHERRLAAAKQYGEKK